jgi:hypothetical protein
MIRRLFAATTLDGRLDLRGASPRSESSAPAVSTSSRRSASYGFDMAESLPTEEQTILEELLVPAFRAILSDGPMPTDPAELELLAATLLVPLELPEMPAAVIGAFFGEIEARGDEAAASILSALAVLCTGDAATAALDGVERLAARGVSSPATGKVGGAVVRAAVAMTSDDAELLVALLGRPKGRRLQVAMLGIEHADTGGALVECMLSPPMPAAKARALLEQTDDAGRRAEPIEPDELVARALAAAQLAVDLDIQLGHEAAIAMPIIARALTGDPAGLPRPETIPPWEDDDPELIVDAIGDEDGYQELTAQLLAELADWAHLSCPPDGPVWRSGDFVASTMLDWKGGYGDGHLGRWTRIDLAEFLLDWFPRKVTAEPETLEDVIDCVIAFLRFLDERESLSGEPLDVLAEASEELREEFLEATADPSSWGLAKSLAMQMLADGVDPEDPDALETWMTHFNGRSLDERDAVIGAPADRMLGRAQPVGGTSPAKRSKQAAQRKSQRAARKRNRRR